MKWINSAKNVYIGFEIGSGGVQSSPDGYGKGHYEIRNDQFLPVLQIQRTKFKKEIDDRSNAPSYNTNPSWSHRIVYCYGDKYCTVCHCNKWSWALRYCPHRGYNNFCYVHNRV